MREPSSRTETNAEDKAEMGLRDKGKKIPQRKNSRTNTESGAVHT